MSNEYEFIFNVCIDTCVFNSNNSKIENDACVQILEWAVDCTIVPIFPHSVVKEVERKKTPSWVQKIVMQSIQTCKRPLTAEQRMQLRAIEDIVIGNGKRDNYKDDAMHTFISQEIASYLVTLDDRLIRKRDKLKEVVKDMRICLPSEFVKIVEDDRIAMEEHKKWISNGRKGIVKNPLKSEGK